VNIEGREIANGLLPYWIAEVSCNHLGSVHNALSLIRYAKESGANAVKFQAYTPDTITLNCDKTDFIVQDGLWKGRNLYDLYKKAQTPFEWFPKLFKEGKRLGITVFASVFDYSSVDMLERLGCPAYKIASMEIVDTPLIKYAARTGKPLVISTGMASNSEILAAKLAAGGPAIFLHCTSEYPGTIHCSDLKRINRIAHLLDGDCPVGLSDHTRVNSVTTAVAVGLGAAVFERHLRLPEDNTSEDFEFSLSPAEFGALVDISRDSHLAMLLREPVSNPSRQMRRSLYAVADIKEGEPFTEDNIRSIRPGYGIAPKHLPLLLGKAADRQYRRGDRIT
jgi:pseudaminic acid synthase